MRCIGRGVTPSGVLEDRDKDPIDKGVEHCGGGGLTLRGVLADLDLGLEHTGCLGDMGKGFQDRIGLCDERSIDIGLADRACLGDAGT